MRTLNLILPNAERLEVSIDNHLVGWVERWEWIDEVYVSERLSIPLPDGNWRIIEDDYRGKIKLGDYS